MNIHAKEGSRVRFAHPTAGYLAHQVTAANHLTEGAEYTVERTDVGGWHTDVFLKEVPDVAFNSVMFDDVSAEIEPEPEEQLEYPPNGTEETALIISLSSENYAVIHHTGRFMFAQCVEAGFTGEEIGLSDVPDEPGVWFMSNGKTWQSTDWETGYVDDYGIGGEWRRATSEDFAKLGIECPVAFKEGEPT